MRSEEKSSLFFLLLKSEIQIQPNIPCRCSSRNVVLKSSKSNFCNQPLQNPLLIAYEPSIFEKVFYFLNPSTFSFFQTNLFSLQSHETLGIFKFPDDASLHVPQIIKVNSNMSSKINKKKSTVSSVINLTRSYRTYVESTRTKMLGTENLWQGLWGQNHLTLLIS